MSIYPQSNNAEVREVPESDLTPSEREAFGMSQILKGNADIAQPVGGSDE